MADALHSAAYFGDSRDFWWNRDFLELMSRRWKLAQVRRVLDVGCGQGHWGRCLAPFLPGGCEVVGVDREPRWVAEAGVRSAAFPELSWRFEVGVAENLPFADDTFDLVTCQTVLIHVRDPQLVLREMLRVLRPGGLLAVVEPNNFSIDLEPTDIAGDPTEVLSLVEFQLRCEQGKMRLGEGFNSIGPQIPGLLSELGLAELESWQSDKTVMLLPPYASPEAQALLADQARLAQGEFWIWNRADTRRYFLAGGGDVATFETLWTRALAREARALGAARARRLIRTTAPTCLLVSGRKVTV